MLGMKRKNTLDIRLLACLKYIIFNIFQEADWLCGTVTFKLLDGSCQQQLLGEGGGALSLTLAGLNHP